MDIQIKSTRQEDSETIFSLYDDAIAYQKKVGNNHWLGFEPELITKEINIVKTYFMMIKYYLVNV